jgi:hypothetical protein
MRSTRRSKYRIYLVMWKQYFARGKEQDENSTCRGKLQNQYLRILIHYKNVSFSHRKDTTLDLEVADSFLFRRHVRLHWVSHLIRDSLRVNISVKAILLLCIHLMFPGSGTLRSLLIVESKLYCKLRVVSSVELSMLISTF